MKYTRLLCATDFHGSDVVFRKFISACLVYEADAAFVAGDLTGKAIVPIIHKDIEKYEGHLSGKPFTATTPEELEIAKKNIADVGFYPVVLDPEEAEEIAKDSNKMDLLFKKVMVERLKSWMELTQVHFKPKGIPLYIIPGNDDDYLIDEVLLNWPGVFNPDGKKQIYKDIYEIIGMAESNMTPWACPRDVEEETIAQKLLNLVRKLDNPKKSIWIFHDPPYNSLLDNCPALEDDLRIATEGGQVLMQSVGSTSIRQAIEEYQPMLTIHGHIHESPGCRKIGKTLCINPGSEYAEGILRVLLINITGDQIKGYVPISA